MLVKNKTQNRLWKTINNLLGRQLKQTVVNQLDIEGETLTNNEDIAEVVSTISLSGLSCKKATGIDKISSKIIKIAAPVISDSLTHIFNQSIAQSFFLMNGK